MQRQKNIQVCGIGNGVVDVQYQISDEFLNELDVPKGEMRLVNAEYHKELQEKLKNIKPNRCGGGSAGNTIDAFAKFGGKAAMLSAVADDENGKFYYSELDRLNIKYKNNLISEEPTGVCFVLITPDGERTMLTSLAASKYFSKKNLSEELIANAQWLYIEGYMLSEDKSAEAMMEAIEIATQNGTKIAISASDVFIVDTFRTKLEKMLQSADLLFCNKNEALALAQEKQDYKTALEKIRSTYPNLNVVMTKGAEGVTILHSGKYFGSPAVEAEVVDTTGAGDMFAGAFLYGMLHFQDIEKAAKLASLAASKIVAKLGARYDGNFNEMINKIK